MGTIRVEKLYYRLEVINNLIFNSPSSIAGETSSFHYNLANDKLTITMKQDCSSVEEARNLVDDYLRSWEIDDALRRGIKRIKFIFDDVKIIDLNNPNSVIIYTEGLSLKLGGSGEVKFIEPSYPNPPTSFKISPDVLTLWQRYEGHLNNREPLQQMAYYCYTFFKSQTGGWKGAAKTYRIDDKVLKKLSELSSTKGDAKTARKFNSYGPLSAVEIEWLRVAVRTIIRRVGEIDNDPSLPTITLNDLPKLP